MKIVAVIFSEETSKNIVVGGATLMTIPIVYALLVLSIWVVNDAQLDKIFSVMFDGTIMGFIAANIMVVVLGSLCLVFGLVLKLFGVF